MIGSLDLLRENRDLFAKVATKEKSAQQNYFKNKDIIDRIAREKKMERDANRIYTDPEARAKYEAQLQREFKEFGDMIDGARKVPAAADKLLKLMELETTIQE